MTAPAPVGPRRSLDPVERDEASAPFFDAAAEGRLVLRHCRACDQWSGPEVASCPRCGPAGQEWVPVGGDGTVVSWVVVHQRDHDGGPPTRSPVVLVELAEGPWLTLPLDPAGDDRVLTIGLPVTVGFAPTPGGETIPVCRPHPPTA